MKFIIDDREIGFEGGKTVLELARQNGIYIPSLCDHPSLKPFGACRLCLVEVKGKRGYVPSCSIYAEDGMVVRTKAPRLKKLQREILELILSEHPNACLICSEKSQCDEHKSTIRKVGETTGCVLCSNNGRCELQDVVEALKPERVSYPSFYHNFEVRRDDPFFDRDYNLCILCGRCVRMCHEVRGASTISFVYRGSETVIGTALGKTLQESGCQFCGACVDVCPTGSLAERAARFQGIPEEVKKTICPLCSVGCSLRVELISGRITSTHPDGEGPVNLGQGCVKGRFTIRDAVYSKKRVLRPLIRVQGKLEEATWEKALDFVAQKLKTYKGEELAFVSTPQCSNEEIYLFHKFARDVLGTGNIASSGSSSSPTDFWDWTQENSLTASLNLRIGDITKARTIFLIGADVTVSHPLVGLEVIRAVQNGGRLIIVNPKELRLSRFSSLDIRINPGADLFFLLSLSFALLGENQKKNASQVEGFDSYKQMLDSLDFSPLPEQTGVTQREVESASKILSSEKPVIFLFGQGLTQHPWGRENTAALWNLALICGARMFPLSLDNNLRGEQEIRRHFAPHGLGFSGMVQAAEEGSIKALYLTGSFPGLEKRKSPFLVCQTCFADENTRLADAVLPSVTFTESEGTVANFEGRLQRYQRVIDPCGQAMPDWWIISQVAQRMGSRKFQYVNVNEICEELGKEIPVFSEISAVQGENGNDAFLRREQKEQEKFILFELTPSVKKTSSAFPFQLLVEYSLDYYRGIDLCQEIKGMRAIRNPAWVMINPDDAFQLQGEPGEEVEVESESGKFSGIIKISSHLPRGIVSARISRKLLSPSKVIPVRLRKVKGNSYNG